MRSMKRKQKLKDEDFRAFKLSKDELAFEAGLMTEKEYIKYVRRKLSKIFRL